MSPVAQTYWLVLHPGTSICSGASWRRDSLVRISFRAWIFFIAELLAVVGKVPPMVDSVVTDGIGDARVAGAVGGPGGTFRE